MIARRAEDIAPFIVMEVMERAREMERGGVDVIHLEVGEPDFDIPPAVKNATCQALEQGLTHYTHSPGENKREDQSHPHQLSLQSHRKPALEEHNEGDRRMHTLHHLG